VCENGVHAPAAFANVLLRAVVRVVRFFVYNSITLKRTEGRAPVWGSEFTTKEAPQGEIQHNLILFRTLISGFCLRGCVVLGLPSGTAEPNLERHRKIMCVEWLCTQER